MVMLWLLYDYAVAAAVPRDQPERGCVMLPRQPGHNEMACSPAAGSLSSLPGS